MAQQSAELSRSLQQQEAEHLRRLEAERQRHFIAQRPPASPLPPPQPQLPFPPFPTPAEQTQGPQIDAVESGEGRSGHEVGQR